MSYYRLYFRSMYSFYQCIIQIVQNSRTWIYLQIKNTYPRIYLIVAVSFLCATVLTKNYEYICFTLEILMECLDYNIGLFAYGAKAQCIMWRPLCYFIEYLCSRMNLTTYHCLLRLEILNTIHFTVFTDRNTYFHANTSYLPDGKYFCGVQSVNNIKSYRWGWFCGSVNSDLHLLMSKCTWRHRKCLAFDLVAARRLTLHVIALDACN